MADRPRRSKLDPHGPELVALARAGATAAVLARWLRVERDAAVAATTVSRWLERAADRGVEPAAGFDADAVLRELRARARAERFPRYAPSSIDPFGSRVLRLRRAGATVAECRRMLRDEHRLRVDRSTVSRWLKRNAGRDDEG